LSKPPWWAVALTALVICWVGWAVIEIGFWLARHVTIGFK